MSEITPQKELQLRINQSLYGDWTPFPAQLKLGRALFNPDGSLTSNTHIFVCNGRGWAKSTSAAWLAAKYALENPRVHILLLAPTLKLARRIYWDSIEDGLDAFIDPFFVKEKSKSRLTLELHNGSKIEIDGADDPNAHRGLRPDLVIADEYKDFHPGWYDAMAPNLSKNSGRILFLGTPPPGDLLSDGSQHHFLSTYERVKEMQDTGQGGFIMHAPTWENPYHDKEFVEGERRYYLEKDWFYIFEREYGAKIISGAKNRIFPMLTREDHEVPYSELIATLHADPDRYDYGCFCDPGTKGAFAVRFMAIDRYTSTPYWVDEIYETNPYETTTAKIIPRIREKLNEIYPKEDSWYFVADSAAASFLVDAWQHHKIPFAPCLKEPGDKREWISIIADVFLFRKRIISDRCQNTWNEYLNYQGDVDGRIVKKNDHLIDADRYGLKFMAFTFNPLEKPKPFQPQDFSEELDERELSSITRQRQNLSKNPFAAILSKYNR